MSKYFILVISSRNKKAAKSFCIYLEKMMLINFNYEKKITNTKPKKSFISILRSPHAYKISQDQYDMTILFIKIKLKIKQLHKFLILLKFFLTSGFSEINLKIVFKIQNNAIIKFINPDYFLIVKKYRNKNQSITKISKFVSVLNMYGKYMKI